jgi:hypothetical protein
MHRCPRGAIALALLMLSWSGNVRAQDASPAAQSVQTASLPDVAARPPSLAPDVRWYPGFARDVELRGRWLRVIELERELDYAGAAHLLEELIGRAPGEPHTYWRAARAYSWLGELTPPADAAARARYGTLAMAWADRGLQIDPRCGECCFYKYAGMGRVASTNGILSSVKWLGEIAQTLDRCLAMPPTFAEEPWNPERGNLYYAASAFYRLLPDSRMLEASVGVRGDPERSLELARRASALVPQRVDYTVGLGAALLCAGDAEERDELIAEGKIVLARVPQLRDRLPTDRLDRRGAEHLLGDPEDACAYTRDTWFDGRGRVARSGG